MGAVSAAWLVTPNSDAATSKAAKSDLLFMVLSLDEMGDARSLSVPQAHGDRADSGRRRVFNSVGKLTQRLFETNV
ncbi:hypothetical protein DAQ1742_02427 [Dickeya aquatica]|uniref:Uncharacterized protein n=1 Tax=Dickeya aquatica TaxID=1401087 RepID=A0A375ABC1_9GAMM|nr:hypothetical protein DAQ1742_02427 [Dickeya aquatica]